MSSSNNSNSDLDPLTGPQRYVQQNRDDLITLIKHGDPFIRTLALTILYESGQEADIDRVIYEPELLKELDDDELPSRFNR